jgi:hypothetical protein
LESFNGAGQFISLGDQQGEDVVGGHPENRNTVDNPGSALERAGLRDRSAGTMRGKASPRGWAKIQRTCYPALVPVQTCTVSFTDGEGIRHSVNVQAATLFEAAEGVAGVVGRRASPAVVRS